ncbi:hypothetical protein I302_107150 [Kwoniella bestiolae CBS 10118]|uniref:CoA-binding domain-containing protein n=1 Tax=Kwoniella bestiolae CBS 10118 TaxID=1296100 RepID=A0A1B9FZE1_9TREE|nr:hypothetical protein I302_05583 [Kwoniella bestiolae CBS 10118]OCF24125.1 hypothetical protein I302_05583 [Kwoniella bestiolae CBS 10118]
MPPSPVTESMKYFLQAEKFGVIGRTMSDRSRWDNKILRWYQQRDFPVTAVRPNKPSEEVEGLRLLTEPTQIPDLPSTSISIIINPLVGIDILKSLYPIPPNPIKEPRGIWFQPGADSADIWEYVKKRGIEDKVIGQGACVYRDGDGVLEKIKEEAEGKGGSKL